MFPKSAPLTISHTEIILSNIEINTSYFNVFECCSSIQEWQVTHVLLIFFKKIFKLFWVKEMSWAKKKRLNNSTCGNRYNKIMKVASEWLDLYNLNRSLPSQYFSLEILYIKALGNAKLHQPHDPSIISKNSPKEYLFPHETVECILHPTDSLA